MNIKSLDLFSQQFHQNPYDYYEKIRPHQPFAKVKMLNDVHNTWMAFTILCEKIHLNCRVRLFNK